MKLSFPFGLFREAYYKAAPYSLRKLFCGKRRNLEFQQAMALFLNRPEACANSGNPLFLDLIHGWGNEAWSAREEFLAACVSCSLAADGPILECGSGLSTLLIAAIAKKQGQCHWVLEHKPAWANKVRQHLGGYGLDALIQTQPLKDYGDFCWYDAPLELMPPSFSLIVCDGPPRRTKGGRIGLLPVLKKKLKSGCVILLDDAYRQEELDIATRWADELNTSFTVQGRTKPYLTMTVP